MLKHLWSSLRSGTLCTSFFKDMWNCLAEITPGLVERGQCRKKDTLRILLMFCRLEPKQDCADILEHNKCTLGTEQDIRQVLGWFGSLLLWPMSSPLKDKVRNQNIQPGNKDVGSSENAHCGKSYKSFFMLLLTFLVDNGKVKFLM